ncbi:MAG: transcription elongation factor GreA [Deltaproteobacteria bacterium]|nr:transcription elongation factor GreA [Deltaproteobacteria bacterium]
MSESIPITRKGFEAIKEELQRLLTRDRPEIQKAIAEAREHGDLRENAEYHAAKERQGFIEGRIQEINAKMPLFQVVDPGANNNNTNKVVFGARVTLENLETEEELVYQIVGQDEADIKNQRISLQSPIARALIGKFVGDVVQVIVPKGQVEVEIKEVSYL